MRFVDGFKHLMKDSVVRYPFVSRDTYRKPTYGTAQPLSHCRVVKSNKLVRTADGDEAVSTCQLWIADEVTISTQDKLQLADGSTPSILSVDTSKDENGSVPFTKVYFR